MGVNVDGEVVGYYTDSIGSHGYVYLAGNYTTLDDPNALPGNTFAEGINAEGEIVGYYNDASGSHGFLAVPTPEPGTLPLLMGCGIILNAVIRKTRRTPS